VDRRSNASAIKRAGPSEPGQTGRCDRGHLSNI